MEITQLTYFKRAAETENFSHVAQEFLVPTSSVSASVKKLETELGIKLFERSSNKIKLNEYGRIFLSALQETDDIIKKARADMLNLSGTPSGEIRLLILTNRRRVTETIAQFKIKYPGISFSIKHQNQTEHTGYNEYDIVISDRHINSDRFDSKLWTREEILLAVHKSNPLSEKNFVTLKDLKNEKFICMPKNSSIRDLMDNFFEGEGITADIAIECDDPQYLRKYVEIGLGVTFFPSVSWGRQISDSVSLVRINKGIYRDTYIHTAKNAPDGVKLFSMEMTK